MTIALFAGSFDPPHRGHLDLIMRGSRLFDRLVVAVGTNAAKSGLLPEADRISLVSAACRELPNVHVRAFTGAVTALAREVGATVLLRGIRHGRDADYELPMVEMNRRHGVESLALFAAIGHQHISSSLVRELLKAGLPLDDLVMPEVVAALRRVVPS